MTEKLITFGCKCGKRWVQSLEQFNAITQAEWDWWIDRGLVNVKDIELIKSKHERTNQKIDSILKKQGYIFVFCPECKNKLETICSVSIIELPLKDLTELLGWKNTEKGAVE